MVWSLIAEKIYRPYKPNLNWAKKHVKFRKKGILFIKMWNNS